LIVKGSVRTTALRFRAAWVARTRRGPTATRRCSRRPWLVAPAAICALSSSCLADDFTLGDVWQDTKLYFTAPLRWDSRDWLFFAGTLAAVGAAHEFDGNVRRDFATGSRAVLNGSDKNSVRDAIPAGVAVVGTWLAGTLLDERDGRVEAYAMLEAAGFSAVTTEALKYAAGRSRPNETTHVDAWRKGGSSFPSLHASAAFAIGTVLAESGNDDYRWLRRIIGYGLAAGTGYVRLHDNVHWTSDVVAGSAIGIATAHFTLNRREARSRSWNVSFAPMEGGGTMLNFSMALE
jgi:membrane-associated phospholipid phosphatase